MRHLDLHQSNYQPEIQNLIYLIFYDYNVMYTGIKSPFTLLLSAGKSRTGRITVFN